MNSIMVATEYTDKDQSTLEGKSVIQIQCSA